jgi:hypothetical protein
MNIEGEINPFVNRDRNRSLKGGYHSSFSNQHLEGLDMHL